MKASVEVVIIDLTPGKSGNDQRQRYRPVIVPAVQLNRVQLAFGNEVTRHQAPRDLGTARAEELAEGPSSPQCGYRAGAEALTRSAKWRSNAQQQAFVKQQGGGKPEGCAVLRTGWQAGEATVAASVVRRVHRQILITSEEPVRSGQLRVVHRPTRTNCVPRSAFHLVAWLPRAWAAKAKASDVGSAPSCRGAGIARTVLQRRWVPACSAAYQTNEHAPPWNTSRYA